MTARTLYLTFTLAAFALSGSLAPAQQPPAPPTATAADTSTPAAPIERHPPADQEDPSAPHHHMRLGGMRPNNMHPDQDGQPNFRAGMQDRNHFRQGPNNFRYHQFHRMDADFRPGSHGMWWKNPMLAQRLALTPEQTTKLDSISQQAQLHRIDLQANLERQQTLLEPMLSANPVDTTRTLAQIDKVAEARAALEESQARTMLTLRAVITPNQWTKLTDHRTPHRFGPGVQDSTPAHWRHNSGPPPNSSNLIDSPITPQ